MVLGNHDRTTRWYACHGLRSTEYRHCITGHKNGGECWGKFSNKFCYRADTNEGHPTTPPGTNFQTMNWLKSRALCSSKTWKSWSTITSCSNKLLSSYRLRGQCNNNALCQQRSPNIVSPGERLLSDYDAKERYLVMSLFLILLVL